MADSTNGRLFIKGNKIVLESKKNFMYERTVYIIYPRLVYVVDSKLLESSEFSEDSILNKKMGNEKYLICTELVSAESKWINENGFVVFEVKSKIRKKKKENN